MIYSTEESRAGLSAQKFDNTVHVATKAVWSVIGIYILRQFCSSRQFSLLR